jgi:hypothetical protein
MTKEESEKMKYIQVNFYQFILLNANKFVDLVESMGSSDLRLAVCKEPNTVGASLT